MADKFLKIVTSDGSEVLQRLVDNGDGTWSPSITGISGGGGGGGDTSNIATVGNAVPLKAAYVSGKKGANSAPFSMGVQADADSLGVTLSTETKAQIGATNEAAATSDTATSGLNGLLKRIAQNITTLISSVLTVKGSRNNGDVAAGTTFINIGATDGTNLRNLLLDSSGRLVIVPSGGVTTTEASLALTAGSSATVAASNTNRLSITIDNPNAADIWINTQGAAVAAAGSSMRHFGNTKEVYSVQEIGTGAITVICASNATIRYREISKV